MMPPHCFRPIEAQSDWVKVRSTWPLVVKLFITNFVHLEIRARSVAVGDDIRISKIDESVGVELGTRTPGIVHVAGESGIEVEGDGLPRICGGGRRRQRQGSKLSGAI